MKRAVIKPSARLRRTLVRYNSKQHYSKKVETSAAGSTAVEECDATEAQ